MYLKRDRLIVKKNIMKINAISARSPQFTSFKKKAIRPEAEEVMNIRKESVAIEK
jgi:hypothetical protein